jgi:hypothetical protein
MIDFDPQPDVIRWSSSDIDIAPEVIELQLLLPTATYLALEASARKQRMTVGQMARVFITQGTSASS